MQKRTLKTIVKLVLLLILTMGVPAPVAAHDFGDLCPVCQCCDNALCTGWHRADGSCFNIFNSICDSHGVVHTCSWGA